MVVEGGQRREGQVEKEGKAERVKERREQG